MYYRLSTVEINLPPLRERKEDIPLLFRKFAADFAQKYNMPTLRLDESAQALLCQQEWKGNIRQLRNIAEQMSILEKERNLKIETLNLYLPNKVSKLPATLDDVKEDSSSFSSEREILYKVLFDMKRDINDLKKLVLDVVSGQPQEGLTEQHASTIRRLHQDVDPTGAEDLGLTVHEVQVHRPGEQPYQEPEEVEESLSLADREIELIKKALEKNRGKRKAASQELGISERTLYRKIKEYNLG